MDNLSNSCLVVFGSKTFAGCVVSGDWLNRNSSCSSVNQELIFGGSKSYKIWITHVESCLSSHSRAFLAFISKEAIGAGAYALAPENISTQKVILSVQVTNHRLQVMGMLVGLKRANPRESQVQQLQMSGQNHGCNRNAYNGFISAKRRVWKLTHIQRLTIP